MTQITAAQVKALLSASAYKATIGAMRAARERGLCVPEDVSVVGYNDIPFCDKFAPPLTTVRIPHYQVGVKAAELMVKTVQDPATTPVSLRLPPSLVVRESTGPASA